MTCIIPGCTREILARGWCGMHYARWREHGNPVVVLKKQSPAGAPETFLSEMTAYSGDECRSWPFAKNNMGYAQINRNGTKFLVTRLICEAIHGSAPSPAHHAAHSCGNGHLGCVTPRHLRWATILENARERIEHGRSCRGEKSWIAKVTQKQAEEIYRRAWSGERQQKLADEFGLSQTAISRIKLGKNWGWMRSPS